MPTQSTPTFSHLKPHLQRLEKDEPLQLLRELYALNADNKLFLATRFLATTPEEMAEPYRKIIRQVFYPNRGAPSLDLSAARKALNDFKKVCADQIAVVDFMLFYVEQGVICTNTYGDIDAPFYNSLVSVYRKAAELAAKIANPDVVEPFRPRFLKIVWDTGNIGWGFHDDLSDIYDNILPPEAGEMAGQRRGRRRALRRAQGGDDRLPPLPTTACLSEEEVDALIEGARSKIQQVRSSSSHSSPFTPPRNDIATAGNRSVPPAPGTQSGVPASGGATTRPAPGI